MAVVNHKQALGRTCRQRTCSMCGELCRSFPFIEYNTLIICRGCISYAKRGLIADLVHAEAIIQLQKAGYPDETLARMRETTAARLVEWQEQECDLGDAIYEIRLKSPGNAQGDRK